MVGSTKNRDLTGPNGYHNWRFTSGQLALGKLDNLPVRIDTIYNVLRFQTFDAVDDLSFIVLATECVEHVAEHTARVILPCFVQRRAG